MLTKVSKILICLTTRVNNLITMLRRLALIKNKLGHLRFQNVINAGQRNIQHKYLTSRFLLRLNRPVK